MKFPVANSARARIRIAVTLLAMVGLVLLPAVPAQASDDATWAVRTASNVLGAERTSYSYTISPGAEVEDALVVTNRGADSLDLGVYAADGYTTDSGQFDLVPGGAKSVSIGAWVRTDSDSITVKPGATRKIPFKLTVPQNASPGDYAGGIVTSLVQPDDAAGINVDRRLGIRITLRVSGDLKPSLAIEHVHVDWSGGLNPFAGGDAHLTYTIHNTGNAVVSASQAATVAGPFGWWATKGPAIKPPPQLLPGETWDVSVPFHGVAAVVWLAAATTVVPEVTDASGSSTNLDPITATANGWAVPWTLVVIVLIVIASVIVLPRARRRRREKQQAREDARVQEAVDLALTQKGALDESVTL